MAKNLESPWIRWQEVQEFFGCSRSKAYNVIRELNKELKAKGYLTYDGRVARRYFNERYYA